MREYPKSVWESIGEDEFEGDFWENDEEEARVVKLGYVVKSFNEEGKQSPLIICEKEKDGWEEKETKIEVPFLDLAKNDIFVCTREAAGSSWLEGYRANDKVRKVGIVHEDFINFFEF
jgi:hypothetical protein